MDASVLQKRKRWRCVFFVAKRRRGRAAFAFLLSRKKDRSGAAARTEAEESAMEVLIV